ncbi:hypothetical protein [Halocynthiibacter namhaensis]|uniref:hypothetical protein n=1 Tax=Halocynthiibacter namhaensis TaxID=1290553 RepID=UPI0005794C2D|nr:hypothetical protein [Halocynthiibacter namhaensis]
MSFVIWPGAAISFLGLCGIIWCIVQAMKARKSGLDDEAMRKRLQTIVTVNLSALALSGIGLMMVVVGVILS